MKRDVWLVRWRDDRDKVHEMIALRSVCTETTARALARDRFPKLVEIVSCTPERVQV